MFWPIVLGLLALLVFGLRLLEAAIHYWWLIGLVVVVALLLKFCNGEIPAVAMALGP